MLPVQDQGHVAAAVGEGVGRRISAHSVELHGHCNTGTFRGLSEELKQALQTPSGPCLSTALHERSVFCPHRHAGVGLHIHRGEPTEVISTRPQCLV